MIRNLVPVLWVALSWPALGQQGVAPPVNTLPKGESVQHIIQSFAAKEKEFQQARQQYNYTEDVSVTASCQGKEPGVYHLIADMTLDRNGNRLAKVKSAESTLQCIEITKEDLESFRDQSLLVLTTDEIQNYRVNFIGQQYQDNLPFYVFDVSPVTVPAGTPTFEGRIWVDGRDFAIVKSDGTITVNKKKKRKGEESLIPAVTTWREQIDGRYWFPAYSRGKDALHFSSGDVQIEEAIKLTNYKALTP